MSALPPNWTKYSTPDGKDYFHNSITNQTQWKPPESRNSNSSEAAVYNPSLSELNLEPKKETVAGETPSVNMNNPFDTKPTFNNISLSGNDMAPLKDFSGSGGGNLSSDVNLGQNSLMMSNGINGLNNNNNSVFPFGGPGRIFSFFNLAYWQTFFDVSTADVIRRTKSALIPKKEATPESIQDFRQNPDLWGPFWICTTLVVFLSATGNLGQLLAADADSLDSIQTNWELVTLAAGMMYGALFGVPICTFALHYFAGQQPSEDDANFRSMMCTYGYSFISLLPASILMLIPIGIWKWLVCITGCALACLFVKNHLWNDFAAITDQRLRYAVMGLLFGTHIVIYGTYRLYFF